MLSKIQLDDRHEIAAKACDLNGVPRDIVHVLDRAYAARQARLTKAQEVEVPAEVEVSKDDE